jgi:DNA-binding PadR family transcriptional regulator
MFRHLVLGLLRDGQPRHGYELTTEYARRAATSVNTGNFYRELQKLATEALVETKENPPDADARRIPYQITELGCREFDEWLAAPCDQHADLGERLLFVDIAPPEVLHRLLDWWQDDLWMRSKALARAREEAIRATTGESERFDPLPVLLSRRMKLIAAELEFLHEFRGAYDAWERGRRESGQANDRAHARRAKGAGKK